MTGTDDSQRRLDHRRRLTQVLLLVLLGGGLLLLSASRTWLRVTAARPAPFGRLSVNVSGRAEFAAVAGLAVVLVLGAVLCAVTGRWARTALGVLLSAVSVAAGWYCVRGFATPSPPRLVELLGGSPTLSGVPVTGTVEPVWCSAGLVGAALSLLGSLAVLRFAREWPSGLSGRFEAPVSAAAGEDPWRALDRGDDPTIADR